MADGERDGLIRQLDIAWALTAYHLTGLTTAECLWRPGPVGLHIRTDAEGIYHADWPDRETYDLGPPSIAWLTWHLGFWWSMALNHNFGPGTLTREAVTWPGTAEGAREWIGGLHGEWRRHLELLEEPALSASDRARWPFQQRPLRDIVAWANLELMKNAAEIGYARFLYGARSAGVAIDPAAAAT